MCFCEKCGEPVQVGQERCHDCSLSDYSCIVCGWPLENGRVEFLRSTNPDGQIVCKKHSEWCNQKPVAEADWNGHSYSTAYSRFHKGSAYLNPEAD